jgi:predicted MPP superfamily phosphohydrolase
MPGSPRTAPDVNRRSVLQTLVAAGIGVVTGGLTHGVVYERHRIGVTRATLAVSALPAALEGLRIALITDLHLSAMVPAEDVAETVRIATAERPDLVILGGDYVSFGDRRYMAPCAALLGPLTAANGVYAVLGNHDDETEMSRALAKNGVGVLADDRTTITVRGERVELVGLRFWTRKTSDITRLLRGATGWTVLLAHDPRRFDQAVSLNVPLLLSGHTHGGQIVLPGIGALAARKFPIAEGSLSRENTMMFVSRGVGTIYVPCRISCPPEVAILTLARAHRLREGASSRV